MSKLLYIAFLTALLWLCPMAFSADIVPAISYKYYDVNAEKGHSLSRSLFGATPVFHEGQNYAGLTNSYFAYQYETEEFLAGVCQMQNINVRVDCVITLPRLVSAEAKLNDIFDKYLERLKAHELEHCRITNYYASQFKKYLEAQPPIKCVNLKATVTKEHQKIIHELNAEQKNYDLRTVHGKYEGADLKKYEDEAAGGAPEPIPGKGGLSNLDYSEDLIDSGIYKDKNGVWRNY